MGEAVAEVVIYNTSKSIWQRSGVFVEAKVTGTSTVCTVAARCTPVLCLVYVAMEYLKSHGWSAVWWKP